MGVILSDLFGCNEDDPKILCKSKENHFELFWFVALKLHRCVEIEYMDISVGDEDDIEATRTEVVAHLKGVSADMVNL